MLKKNNFIVWILTANLILLAVCFCYALLQGNIRESYIYIGQPRNTQLIWYYTDGRKISWVEDLINKDRTLDWKYSNTGGELIENKTGTIWYKSYLANIVTDYPAVYFPAIDQNCQIYIDNIKIYEFGASSSEEFNRFNGWSWHLVNLPDGCQGKTIYIRVHSSDKTIGFDGAPVFGNRFALLHDIQQKSEFRYIMGIFIMVMGIYISMIFLFSGAHKKDFIYFGIFGILMGLYVITQTKIKMFYFDKPLFWTYADLYTLFIIPGVFLLFYREVFNPVSKKLFNILIIGCMVFSFAAIVSDLVGIWPAYFSLSLFNVLELINVLIIFFSAASMARKSDARLKILLAGLAAFLVCNLCDILASLGYHWVEIKLTHLGTFCLMVALSAVMLMHYRKLHRQMEDSVSELKLHQDNLQQLVDERTASLRASEQRYKEMAYYDTLTGLPNRKLFHEKFVEEINEAKIIGEKIAVLFLDMNNLKKINDRLGHEVGDNALVEFSRRIQLVCDDGDFASRLGGDEFTVLVKMNNDFAVREVIDKIHQVLQEPWSFGAEKIQMQVSIGVSVYPDDGDTAEVLLQKADMAMYEDKRRKKDINENASR